MKSRISKRFVRFIAFALVLCVTALSLSGCTRLDELRSHHITYKGDSDENLQTLFLNGSEYKKLTALQSGDNPILDCADDYLYNITAEDVPDLLSEMYGYYASVSEGEELIFYGVDCFARSDVFDKYDSIIKKHDLSLYLSQFSYYPPVGSYNSMTVYGDMKDIRIVFENEGKQILDAVFAQEPLHIPYDEYVDNSVHYFTIFRCDSELFIARYGGYLSTDDTGRYFIEGYSDTSDDQLVYIIPEEYQQWFKDRFDKFEDNYYKDLVSAAHDLEVIKY